MCASQCRKCNRHELCKTAGAAQPLYAYWMYYSSLLLSFLTVISCNLSLFHRSADDQESLFDQILLGQLEFPLPYWDNVSDSAKVCDGEQSLITSISQSLFIFGILVGCKWASIKHATVHETTVIVALTFILLAFRNVKDF